MDVKISGRDVPVDEPLLAAMGPYRGIAESLHPTGRGEFIATVRRNPGDTRTTTTIHIDFRDMTVCYEAFPYPLEDVTGKLHIVLGPKTRLEFENFKGHHHGGEVTISGVDDIASAGNVLKLDVKGVAIPFDAELAKAVRHLRLQSVWRALGPRGRLGFTAQITQIDKAAPPNMPKPPNELEIAFNQMHADSIMPDFLPYELTDVSTGFQFSRNAVTITELIGRHGAARVQIGPSKIMMKPAGGIWGNFHNLQITPLIPDEDFLRALPSTCAPR